MDWLKLFSGLFVLIISLSTRPNPHTNQISYVKDSQKIVLYNYTDVRYSSPFAMDYSYLLTGSNISLSTTEFNASIQKQVEPKAKFNFNWLINLDRLCPLPDGAKIEIDTSDTKYVVEKTGQKLDISEGPCQQCDIRFTLDKNPESFEESKKFIKEGSLHIDLIDSVFTLTLKGYASTYYCLQNM